MKGPSEGMLREALSDVDLSGLVVYKPPDDARNWKPADYMVWWLGGSAWLEVKATDAADTWPLSELRKSQRLGIEQARRADLPYVVCVYWQRHHDWTLSLADELVDAGQPRFTRTELMSRYGVEARPTHLASTLRGLLTGTL